MEKMVATVTAPYTHTCTFATVPAPYAQMYSCYGDRFLHTHVHHLLLSSSGVPHGKMIQYFINSQDSVLLLRHELMIL